MAMLHEDPTSMDPNIDGSEFYLHFVYIFACLFALVRFTHLIENFVASLIQKKVDVKKNEEDEQRLLAIIERLKALEVKTTNIARNIESMQKLRYYEARNDLLNGQQNIFISNRFFNLNQITPMKQNTKNGFSSNGYHSSEADIMSKVWYKYFAMQNAKPTVAKAQQLPIIKDPEYECLSAPNIVSTAELESMLGLDN